MSFIDYFIEKKLYIVLVIAFLFMGIGAYVYKDGKAPKGWEKAKGSVVAVISNEDTDSDGNTSTTYTPVVRYQANGASYKVRSSYSSSSQPDVGS
ncbi:MAG: DUF3592 domain-containing protein [Acidimicrobiia bacterium]